MRKQTKLVAVLSATALFAIGASMTSFAATAHWEQEGEDWVYLDSDGDRVTDTWKKSGNNWFYLDSDGYMAKDAIVISGSNDDKYYVDANGVKVTNTWVSVDNEGDNECSDQDDISTVWYFFGSDGKAKRGDGKKIVKTGIPYGANMENKGTFGFDEDGHMLSGWQDIELSVGEKTYYFGDENEGWAALGWKYLEKPDTAIDEDDPYEDEAWFWFGTNGRAVKNSTKYINGQYYTFDADGAMDDTWVTGTPGVSDSTASVASGASAFYTEDIGHRRTGWIYTYAPDDKDEEGDQDWYYLNTKGEAFNSDAKDSKDYGAGAEDMFDSDSYDDVAARVIKNKTYLFDGDGKMITGVVQITDHTVNRVGGTELALGGIYYFSEDDGSSKGQMETGKVTYDDDGEEIHFYFKKNGQAYINAYVKGCIYDETGKRVDAEDGSKYMLYTTRENIYVDGNTAGEPAIKAGTQVVVNTSGTVKKSGTVEVDGIKYEIGKANDFEATMKPSQD